MSVQIKLYLTKYLCFHNESSLLYFIDETIERSNDSRVTSNALLVASTMFPRERFSHLVQRAFMKKFSKLNYIMLRNTITHIEYNYILKHGKIDAAHSSIKEHIGGLILDISSQYMF